MCGWDGAMLIDSNGLLFVMCMTLWPASRPKRHAHYKHLQRAVCSSVGDGCRWPPALRGALGRTALANPGAPLKLLQHERSVTIGEGCSSGVKRRHEDIEGAEGAGRQVSLFFFFFFFCFFLFFFFTFVSHPPTPVPPIVHRLHRFYKQS